VEPPIRVPLSLTIDLNPNIIRTRQNTKMLQVTDTPRKDVSTVKVQSHTPGGASSVILVTRLDPIHAPSPPRSIRIDSPRWTRDAPRAQARPGFAS